jgi:hypothetical protein
VSTPIKVRVTDTCLELPTIAPPAAIKANSKVELPIKVNRLYGYEEQVEITLDVGKDIKGVTATKLTLPKGQAEGKLEIMAAGDAAPGDYQVTVRAKARFNNIELVTTQSIPIKVEAPAPN